MSRGRRKQKNGRRNPRKDANMERTTRDEPLASNESPTFSSRVGITVTSYRVRTADTDGISAKAAIDGLVACGVLRGDTAKEVAWVHYPAVRKVKNEADEKTIIEIEEIE